MGISMGRCVMGQQVLPRSTRHITLLATSRADPRSSFCSKYLSKLAIMLNVHAEKERRDSTQWLRKGLPQVNTPQYETNTT